MVDQLARPCGREGGASGLRLRRRTRHDVTRARARGGRGRLVNEITCRGDPEDTSDGTGALRPTFILASRLALILRTADIKLGLWLLGFMSSAVRPASTSSVRRRDVDQTTARTLSLIMASTELAATYASLILADESVEITVRNPSGGLCVY